MTQSNEPTIEPGSPQYDAVHHWIKRHYGKASKCESNTCEGKSSKFEWALRKGYSYARDRDNFVQLCTCCHRKYDFSEKARIAVNPNLAKGHEARKRPIVKLHKNGEEAGRYESLAQASKDIGCAHSSIIDAIKSNTHVKGFKWRYA